MNRRNRYRGRDWDTGSAIELQIPKLREETYFPGLERRRRAEQALISMVATSYLSKVSTRRVDKLVQTLGIEGSASPRFRSWPRPSTSRWPWRSRQL